MHDTPRGRAAAMRAPEVDAVRSLALFGILMVNLPYLGLPLQVLVTPPSNVGDYIAALLVELLFEGKFFVLFSFLFGWGFGHQLASAEQRRTPARRAYFRRLAALFVIGIAHAVLVFFGDILVLYAVLGALLWAMRDWSARRLLRVAAVALLVAVAALLILSGIFAHDSGTAASAAARPGYLGSFADAVRRRVSDWREASAYILLFNGPVAFAAFAAGLAAFKVGLLSPASASFARFRHRLGWIAVPAIACNLAYVASLNGWLGHGAAAAVAFAGIAIGGPALAAFYLAAVVALVRRGRLHPIATAPGRMPLTVYIGQGIVGGLLFNGYGLGWFGAIGQLGLAGLALSIHVAMTVLAAAWLRHVRQGPLEALLRRLTYGAAR